MAKRGGQTKYTRIAAQHICERLAQGETLRAICRSENVPPESTVRRWVVDDRNGFAAQYARARDIGLDAMADELMEVADDARNDYMEREDPNNHGYALNGEHVQRSRLRVDSRKWYLSKMAPKRYGERTQHELTGANGGPIEMDAGERSVRLSGLLSLAKARRDKDD